MSVPNTMISVGSMALVAGQLTLHPGMAANTLALNTPEIGHFSASLDKWLKAIFPSVV